MTRAINRKKTENIMSTQENEKVAQNAPKFKVNGFYMKDLSFESPSVPAIFTQKAEPPKLDMSVDVIVSKIEGSAFEVALKISAKAAIEEKTLFLTELVHAGIFVLNPELGKEEMEKLLLIDCPTVLFPFSRQIISFATQNGGFAPLILDPVDFEAIYVAKKNAAAKASKQTADA